MSVSKNQKILLHFNIFKFLSINKSLKNLGYFEIDKSLSESDNLYIHNKNKYCFGFDNKSLKNQIKEENIHFLYVTNSPDIFKDLPKNMYLILFLTGNDGILLNKFYYGLEMSDDFKINNPTEPLNKIAIIKDKHSYYVLNDTGYPFFLINDNEKKSYPICTYNDTYPEYNINEILDNSKKISETFDKNKYIRYDSLVNEIKQNNDNIIKFDNEAIVINYKGTFDFKDFYILPSSLLSKNINNTDLKKILKIILNSYIHYENEKKFESDNLSTITIEILEKLKKLPKIDENIYTLFLDILFSP